MTDQEIRDKVWGLFDRHRGIDSQIISMLMSFQGAMAGERISVEQIWREFVAIDDLLDEVRELVKPDFLKHSSDTARFLSF